MADQHPLDNPVWHALTGPHEQFAIGRWGARHYPRAMAPLSAIENPSAASYADLGIDLPAYCEARLIRPREEPTPPGWTTVRARPILQMVADSARPAGRTDDIDNLDGGNIQDMLALTKLVKPGPFGPRTIEMGRFVGISRGGKLIAMAGERLLLPGYVEVSAIATHPDARGQGLAGRLVNHLVRTIVGAGDEAFLHIYPDDAAIAFYQRLGFRKRATLWVIWRKPNQPG